MAVTEQLIAWIRFPGNRSSLGMILYLARIRPGTRGLATAPWKAVRNFSAASEDGLGGAIREYTSISHLKLAGQLAARARKPGALALAYAAAGKSKRAAEILTRLGRLRGQRSLPYKLGKSLRRGRNHVKAFRW